MGPSIKFMCIYYPRYQYMLNERLLAFTHNPRPDSNVEKSTKHMLRMDRTEQMMDMKRRTNFTMSKGNTFKHTNVTGIV